MASVLSLDQSQEKSLLKASPEKSEHSLEDGRINGKRARSLSEDISCSEEKRKHLDAGVIHKGLEAIASSLSVLSGTLGTAMEQGGMDVKKVTEEEASGGVKRSYHKLHTEKLAISPREKNPRLTGHMQMKVACDVAMAMSAKAKLLLRELKGVKAELAFTRTRCHELEEENKRLRESIDTGAACDEEDEDLVRVQLETLLAEKARLAQENTNYARENEILHEVIQYHQLTLQDVMLLNDTLSGGAGFSLEEDLVEDNEHRQLEGGGGVQLKFEFEEGGGNGGGVSSP